MVVKRSTKSKIFITALNLLLAMVFILSTSGYASLQNPHQDPLVLLGMFFIIGPALLVLGVALLFFGERFRVPVINRLLPFFGIVALTVPAFVGSNYRAIGLAGTCIGAILGVLTAATTVIVLVSKRKEIE